MFNFFKSKNKQEVVTPAAPVEVTAKPAEVKKGKIFIAEKSAGGLLPTFFKKSDKDSKQLTEVTVQWINQHNLVNRPYPAASFILLKDRCPILGAAIDAIANDVSSTGWQLSLKEGIKQSSKTDVEREELEAFLKRPNDEDSLKELISSCITDLQTIGDFSLEVACNNSGKVAKIFHVPAHTVFRNKDMDRFVQRRNTKTVFFVPFGSNIVADCKTGEEKEVSTKAKANELIFKKLYNSSSSYYGRSPMLSCVGAVTTSINCEEFNANYFSNRGIPSYVVLLTGEWDEDSVNKMSNYMSKEMRGNENAHRTMVFGVPEGGKAEFEPLENREKEGSFRLYAEDLDDKILAVYKVPRCKVSIQRVGKISGTDTAQAIRNYNDSVVEPLQCIIEDIFNNKILLAVLGKDTSFNFMLNNMHIDDFAEKSDAYTKLLERGVTTPNEIRQKLGLGKEYAEGDKFYIQSSLIESGESPSELGKMENEIEDE